MEQDSHHNLVSTIYGIAGLSHSCIGSHTFREAHTGQVYLRSDLAAAALRRMHPMWYHSSHTSQLTIAVSAWYGC